MLTIVFLLKQQQAKNADNKAELAIASEEKAKKSEQKAIAAAKVAEKEKAAAKKSEKNAQESLKKAKAAEASKNKEEFENLIPRAQSILEVGGCPNDIFDKMEAIIALYPNNKTYSKSLKELQKRQSKNPKCE